MMCHSAFDNIIRTEILQRKAGFNQGSKHVSKRELFHKFAKKKGFVLSLWIIVC